jgi:hypothetical protein
LKLHDGDDLHPIHVPALRWAVGRLVVTAALHADEDPPASVWIRAAIGHG